MLLGLEIRNKKTPENRKYAEELLKKYGLYDFENKYPVHATSYTLSNKEAGVGRAKVDNPTNENTIISQSSNSNDNPKPSTQ